MAQNYTDWQIEEINKCINDFSYFCSTYVKITNPSKGLISFNLYDYQKRVIKDFESYKFSLVSKFRQSGVSSITQTYLLWRCLFKTDQRMMTVSIGDREAIDQSRIVKTMIDYLPNWLKPKLGKANDHEIEFIETNGLMSFRPPKASRGLSLTILVIDEAAFIPKVEEMWAGLYPTLSAGEKCIIISTPNGVGNFYYDMYMGAKEKANIFHIIDIDYREHPEYSKPEWLRQTKANISDRKFKQEYERTFLGEGETYIDGRIISDLEILTRNIEPVDRLLPEYDSNPFSDKELMNPNYKAGSVWIFNHPKANAEYIIGVDCAEGQGERHDSSGFVIIDENTCEQVADFYSNTVKSHQLAQIIYQFGIYYNNASIIIENLGIGTAVLNDLERNWYYENIYQEREDKKGIKTGSDNRPLIIEALQTALETKVLKLNSRRIVSEMSTFVYNKTKRRPEAKKGKHDDLLMALSLALYVRDKRVRNVPLNINNFTQDLEKKNISSLFEKIRAEIRAAAPERWQAEKLDLIGSSPEVAKPLVERRRRPRESLLREFDF